MAVQEACARAPYAADASASRGRLHPEPPSPGRSAFRRDCDRVIHSSAFRRLAHKTQVFVYHEGDHFRTRLTHTLEVTQVARSIARQLGLDEDLAEACALAHDLGHPPFGHAGERALDRCLAAHGGFDHNAQTLAVVTRLERRYPDFDGLNLSWETLEGLVKHNGPLVGRRGQGELCDAAQALAPVIRDYDALHNLDLWSFPSLEAQVGAIADDIAYDAHDIDDGLRAGLFGLDDLAEVEIAAHIVGDIVAAHKNIDQARLAHELIRRLITLMIVDVVAETTRRIKDNAPATVADVRAAESPLVGFSASMATADKAIKAFLWTRMYRHPRVMTVMGDAEGVLADLFERYVADPDALPPEWRHEHPEQPGVRARRIADFIAGMTDRYALIEHRRLFDSTPQLR
ncbi:deoxyguanosinetriphosphate triphosphohydrolase [Rhodoplanes roseus]|uniref:Deoxyguanosinetriphosphate triphosphohydrolase-like protein n=1 Tax=Rhodoplanes roseus TaxID=29409 RepID=A0A327L401_9BRAD|nr:deoxyguanosinetriphosphate triphosphohydrolase [Rhodoplanes roseus]RAI45679.1 deoxyguanosinetriphosphate triphosphohydrolase [Rhodoplanes roseus]